MKIRFTLSILSLLLAFIGSLGSQINGSCGLTPEDHVLLMERLIANKETYEAAPVQTRSSIVKYVPITCILVADDNGNGRAREEQVLEQIASLNQYYAAQELIYYIDEWRYKDHTLIFTDPTHPTSIFQMRLIKDPNAMNVFVTQSAQTDGGLGVTLGFYSPQNDWIVIRKDEFNGFNNTLAHEGGHFWSLEHTFNGWDCTSYDPDEHGNPVNILWSPCNGSLRIELMNGSNCQTAGDLICDTNPDYNFGYGWSSGGDQCAPYTQQVRDSNGDLIDVEEQNQMGYFISCDDYFFTPTQQSLIQTDFFSAARAYLRRSYVPDQDPVENSIVYNYPVNGEETSTFDNVEFDWEDEPGATDYLVIVDRSSSFTFVPKRFRVQESFLTIDELTPNVNYFWKVWPYNESVTGAGWGPTQTFRTGLSSGVKEISSVNRFDVFPNPVRDQSEISIVLESSLAFEAEITLYDLTGEVAWYSSTEQIIAGKENRMSIPTERLSPGLYFLTVQSSEGGIETKKVSVL